MHKLTIVIDAGHGGIDPGATGNGLKEKDRALTYALKIGKELEGLGFNVIYTRTRDQFIELRNRSNLSNNVNATIFISIHLNSFGKASANGAETLFHPGSIKGKSLASKIQNEIVKNELCNSDRGIKPRSNLHVLKATKAPAVLVELGFISNEKDVELLARKEEEIVQAIAKATSEYLGVKYVPPIKDTPEQVVDKPSIDIIKGKVNIMLIAEHIAVDGFFKEDTGYVNINDSYVAIRAMFESMGLNVGWDKDLGVITADTSSDYKRPDNSTKILLLGNRIDVETYIHKDKHCLKIDGAYIPIRDLFEILGFKVSWNGKENMILISK